MHTDEAVHAVKFNSLWKAGEYRYDPHEYHGPTLYYLTFPSVWLSGAEDFGQTEAATYRIVPVVFGVGLILLLMLVADGLGRTAAVCAGALTAVSPAMVYYSRYYIQETLLVFSTFLVIAAGWRYVQTRRARWALLAGAGVGLMYATKETCLIALGAMAVASVLTVLWNRRSNGVRISPRRYLNAKALGGALLVAAVVSTALFSAFFTNLSGPWDSLRAYATYFDRAGGGLHNHPWHYYLRMLLLTRYPPVPAWSEALILGLAAVGGLAAIFGKGIRAGNLPLLRFVTLYTLLMTVLYSAIPYKTPWCMLGFLHGMILLAGAGVVAVVRAARFVPLPANIGRYNVRHGGLTLQVAVCTLLAAGCVHLGVQAWRATIRYPADNRNPYAYAHPVSGVFRLVAYLEQLAAVHPHGEHMLVKVIVPDPWPLPWYLRRFERVGYWEAVPDEPDADVILASHSFQPALEEGLYQEYSSPIYYGLRRDEVLLAYVSQDLRQAFVHQLRSAAAAATQPTAP